jgi:peptidoglycan hydrolase-like protein with peptidoglycan-binding domain
MKAMKKRIVRLFLLLLLGALIVPALPAQAAGLPAPSQLGEQGLHVRLLQEALHQQGFLSIQPDGHFGALTLRAVEQAQRAHQLPVSGQADEDTLAALFARVLYQHQDTKKQSIELSGLDGLTPRESGPGDKGTAVLWLQQALIRHHYLNLPASGVFDSGTHQALVQFQTDQGLAASGRADRDTLPRLMTRPEEAGPLTLMPAWYAGAEDLIPMGATFEIKDVRTGIRFTCARMMGVSHLDAEPVTPYDTQQMNRVYGGTWSWDRRPILLRYQNQVYAASMNGMPHGYVANRQNGMPGHFCVHFSYSRGDGSQRVDTEHLNAAFEASFANWDDEVGTAL